MRVETDLDRKAVYIWLTRAESKREDLLELLRLVARGCKERKILTVIFKSGQESLVEVTATLLRFNRDLD